MRAARIILALVIALSVPAVATPAATQPKVTIPTEGREVIRIRTRPDAVGDTYRYRSETQFIQRGDTGRQTQTNALTFDLEVLGVAPDELRLRYTLREGELEDSGGASMGAAMKAAVGGSLDFRVGREGRITAVDNWPAYKARLLSRLDAALPADDPVRSLVHERMDEPPLAAAQEMVLGDVRIMTLMEPLGGLPLGVTDLSAGGAGTPGRATLEVSVVKPGCVVALARETSRTVSGASRSTVSNAELSIQDGRILVLEERRVTRVPGGSQQETITIRRLSAPPPC